MKKTSLVFLALSLATVNCLAVEKNKDFGTVNIMDVDAKDVENLEVYISNTNAGDSVSVNINRLNISNSTFSDEFMLGAYIDEGETGHKVNANTKEALITDSKFGGLGLILSQAVLEDASGDVTSSVGIANAINSEFNAFLGANGEVNDGEGNANSSLNQVYLNDSKLNNVLFGSRAVVEGKGEASASSNSIFLKGVTGELKDLKFDEDEDELKGGIFGSYAETENGKATALTSYLEISNSSLGNKDAIFTGSYTEGNNQSSSLTEKMIILDSNLTGSVFGAISEGGSAQTNALYVFDSKITGDIIGAQGETGAKAWIGLIGEKENIANNVITGNVIGTISEDGNASSTIYLENYTVNGNLAGSQIFGNGNSNGNQIFLNDGTTIKGNIYGAYFEEDAYGKSNNNIITINGNVTFDKNSQIWGAYAEDFNGQDIFTGNTLNFFGTKGITVDTIGNFENYNFNLANQNIADIKKVDGALITTNHLINQGGQNSTVNVAMSKAQFNEVGSDTLYLVNNKDGEIDADIQMGTVRVGMIHRTSGELRNDDGVWSATIGQTSNNEGQGGLITSENKVPTSEEALNGITAGGNSVDIDSSDILENPTDLTVNSSDVKRLKPLNQGRIQSLMLANLNADYVNQAIGDLRVSNAGDITPFGVIGGGNTKYKTSGSGSKLKSDDFNFVVGTGYNFDNSIAGWFFEYGRGKWRSNNKFAADNDNDAMKIKANDKNYNYGVGLFAKTYVDNFYIDTDIHLGKAKIDFNTNSYTKNGYAYNPNYNHDVSYFGGHVGAGYVIGQDDVNSFDTSVKYLYNQVNGKNQTINEDRFKFKKEVSNRLQVGEQYKFKANEYVALKAGATYEYEFTAKSKAKISDSEGSYSIGNEKLKGSSYIGEFGLELTPFNDKKNSSIDFNVKGYGGKKQGASGNFEFKYSFN